MPPERDSGAPTIGHVRMETLVSFATALAAPALSPTPVTTTPVMPVPAAVAAAAVCPRTVAFPAAPPGTLTSSGAGLRKQKVAVTVPAGWRMTLADLHPDYVDTVVVPQGFYSRSSARAVTFTPETGYIGTATPATISLKGPAGRTRTMLYRPTVVCPPAPSAPPLSSTGAAGLPQSVTTQVPTGGDLALVGENGQDISRLRTPKGEFAQYGASSVAMAAGQPFDPTLVHTTATVEFTATAGATGSIPPVRYRVTDAYGQKSIGLYTPRVTG